MHAGCQWMQPYGNSHFSESECVRVCDIESGRQVGYKNGEYARIFCIKGGFRRIWIEVEVAVCVKHDRLQQVQLLCAMKQSLFLQSICAARRALCALN